MSPLPCADMVWSCPEQLGFCGLGSSCCCGEKVTGQLLMKTVKISGDS